MALGGLRTRFAVYAICMLQGQNRTRRFPYKPASDAPEPESARLKNVVIYLKGQSVLASPRLTFSTVPD